MNLRIYTTWTYEFKNKCYMYKTLSYNNKTFQPTQFTPKQTV